MHWLSPFFYMEAKFGLLEKRVKTIDINRDIICQKNSRTRPFLTQKEQRNFGRVESRNSWRETKTIQIKLATTCNKNEKQQNAKNTSNTEL